MLVDEHELSVPLDHDRPGGDQLTVFARGVRAVDGADRPWLVFFQGGPGYEAARPTRRPAAPGWLERALREFRVLLLDQRGTGRSSPVGPDLAGTPAEQAAYLTHFRADSIVRDAEAFRAALGVERWSVLGQSFGGFCVLRYLSAAPDALREAIITGGLPAIGPDRLEEVYAATWAGAVARSAAFFARYPDDARRYAALRERLATEDVRLPGGDRLTFDRLRAAGLPLGMSDGEEALHHLLELPPDSPAFLHDAEAAAPYARNPLYAVLHEACWADGGTTGWAAARTEPDGDDHLLGEHVLPWLFEDVAGLRPLRDAAQRLAEHEWPRLYDPEQLARNEVPVAAGIWVDDAYVPRALSEETARAVRGLRPWITNEHEHNAITADGAAVLDRLLALARDRR